MLLDSGIWFLTALIFIWLFGDAIGRLMRVLWETLFPIINSKPIDLETKFGKWAVVTGSTDGIGKAYAKELAIRNINLVLISRNLEKLNSTRNEILEMNPKVEVKIITADFAQGKNAFKDISEQLRDMPIGILVNNVGTNYSHPMYVGEVSEDVLWDIINCNVGATTLMTRLVLPGMQARKKGAIINVSSGSEYQPLPLMTVYAATKLYMQSFSKGLRAEYANSGITVQHLTPLFVNTKMNAFSDRLQVSTVFVPSATTYAKNAISTLGKVNTSTGYWAHGIQMFFTVLPPVWLRTKIGKLITETLRQDYYKQQAQL